MSDYRPKIADLFGTTAQIGIGAHIAEVAAKSQLGKGVIVPRTGAGQYARRRSMYPYFVNETDLPPMLLRKLLNWVREQSPAPHNILPLSTKVIVSETDESFMQGQNSGWFICIVIPPKENIALEQRLYLAVVRATWLWTHRTEYAIKIKSADADQLTLFRQPIGKEFLDNAPALIASWTPRKISRKS